MSKTLRVDLGEPGADVVVLAFEEGWGLLDDRDLDAERIENVAHLGRDVPASDHHQRRGEAVEAHDRVGGVVADRPQTGDRRYDRT